MSQGIGKKKQPPIRRCPLGIPLGLLIPRGFSHHQRLLVAHPGPRLNSSPVSPVEYLKQRLLMIWETLFLDSFLGKVKRSSRACFVGFFFNFLFEVIFSSILIITKSA